MQYHGTIPWATTNHVPKPCARPNHLWLNPESRLTLTHLEAERKENEKKYTENKGPRSQFMISKEEYDGREKVEWDQENPGDEC